LLNGLPGVASAEADKATASATVVYDKTVFDVKSVGDEGRYQFVLKQDSAGSESSPSNPAGSGADEDATTPPSSGSESVERTSMIEIESSNEADGSTAKSEGYLEPELNGPGS
jgi:copper chaperone CopZ